MTIEQAQKIIADLTLKHGAGDKYAPIIRWDEFEVVTSALEAAEKRIAELDLIRAAAEKLVRCKGRYHSEQNYRALAELFGVTTPDLPPLDEESSPVTVNLPDDTVDSAERGRNQPGLVVAVHIEAGDFVKVQDQIFEVEETDFDDHDVTLWFVGGDTLKCAAGCLVEVVSVTSADGIAIEVA